MPQADNNWGVFGSNVCGLALDPRHLIEAFFHKQPCFWQKGPAVNLRGMYGKVEHYWGILVTFKMCSQPGIFFCLAAAIDNRYGLAVGSC